MGHARPDTIDVRHILLAEPHRVRLARRALLRGPLLRGGGRRRECEREAQERGRERGSGHDRPELQLGATNVHYRSSMWFSAPVSSVNSMIVASSAATSAAAVPEYRDHRDCHLAGAGAVVQHASLDGGVVRSIR
jgi:hypothetical protein